VRRSSIGPRAARSVAIMATLVTFHAHPDDECINCGGVMRKAADEGHRVVLVVATRGELGEVPDGFLDEGEQLWERRVKETHAVADILGAARVEFLGYTDSGMMGEPTNDAPGTFWTADVEEAAGKLAAILREENADVLLGYDAHGGYGHPDLVQAHRVARLAAGIAATPVLLEVTVDRRRLQQVLTLIRLAGRFVPRLPLAGAAQTYTPPEQITHTVDVRRHLGPKRAALRAHSSQAGSGTRIGTVGLLGRLPLPLFRLVAGREWYVQAGTGPGRGTPPDVFDAVRSR
jgi:LmbE family N-acetylglucosaminyl deacetylase